MHLKHYLSEDLELQRRRQSHTEETLNEADNYILLCLNSLRKPYDWTTDVGIAAAVEYHFDAIIELFYDKLMTILSSISVDLRPY